MPSCSRTTPKLSVEFTADALDDAKAKRGAWFEIAADDPEDVMKKAEAFGARKLKHDFTPFEYIQAPGGQVFRVVSGEEARTLRARGRRIGEERGAADMMADR
jgi:hypothetical protein